MGEEVSKRDINCENGHIFFTNTNISTTSGPDGCVPTLARPTSLFNRLTKTIYHAFTYTEQYKTG